MYAVGDAYRLHTKCIQAYKKRKERIILLTSSLYCLFFYLLLFASSGIPRRTVNKPSPLPVVANSRLLWAFIVRLTGCPPSFQPILIPRSSRVSAGAYAFRPFRRLHCLDGRSKSCMHCMHQKTNYALYARTQLRKRLHTMHTKTRIGVSVGLRARKCMQLGMHTSAYKHIKRGKERILPSTSSLYCLFFIFYCPCLQACINPPDSPLRPTDGRRKKRPTSKGGAFRVTGRNQAVWRPRVGWRRPKPASVRPMPASAMTASMAPPISRPVRARLGR